MFKRNIYIVTVLLCLFISINSRGQQVPTLTGSKEFVSQFYKIFLQNNLNSILKDSTSIYVLNFKIDIVMRNKDNAKAVSVVANDSLAYKIYPNYKALFTLNYRSICHGEKYVTMILPILIYRTNSKKVKYSDADGNALINLQAAVNASYFLYSNDKFSNLNDATENLPYLANRSINGKDGIFRKVVFATPIVCDLTITR